MRSIFSLLIASFLFSFTAQADLPARPEFGVVDRAQILPLPILKATERILSEHQKLTQETVFVVTEPETPSDGIDQEARALVEAWKSAAPKPPNVVVIAVDGKAGKIAIRAGIGLDALVGATSDRAGEIRRTFFDPEWKSGKPSRALVLSIVETLRAMESPLVTSDEAMDTYDHAGFSGGWTPVAPVAKTSTTWIWFLIGALVFGFALYRTVSIEIHTTGEGWRRVPVSEVLMRRLRKKTAPPLVTGGGVSGGY